jgi:23S rRNA (guanosine2251-2'-O)-methyltransferase
VYELDFDINLAVVIGGEGKGIRPLVKKKCDRLFSIPMKGPVSSLNASVSGGIILYEAMRQRIESEGQK